MADVYVTMRDGSRRVFEDNGRAGGSYSQSVRYEPGFAIITDAYGKQTAIPTDTIADIEISRRGGF